MKKLVLNFEKKALKNREMRIKFPDQPEKFMDSEIDLHEALQVSSFIIIPCLTLGYHYTCMIPLTHKFLK